LWQTARSGPPIATIQSKGARAIKRIEYVKLLSPPHAKKAGNAMKSTKVLLVGAAMWSWGGFLMFHGLSMLPLWVVWTVGPLCWYLGAAVALVGAVVTLSHFVRTVEKMAVETERREQAILRFKLSSQFAPASVTHEIPCSADSLIESMMFGLSQGDRL
jgi:hypothetical protein